MAKKATTTKAETAAAVKVTPAKTVAAEKKETAVKAAEAETVKTTEPAAKAEPAKKAEPVKKAEPAKKAAADKKTTTTKKPAAKAAKAAEVTSDVYVQYMGKEYAAKDILANVKKIWTEEMGKKEADLKEVKVYIKPEDDGAYYVFNGDVTGFVKF